MKLEKDKLYKSRNGEVWRVICTDSPNATFPVVAIDSKGDPFGFTNDGRFYSIHQDDPNDLVAECRQPREWLISVCNETGVVYHSDPKDARIPNFGYSECVQVVRVREVIEE